MKKLLVAILFALICLLNNCCDYSEMQDDREYLNSISIGDTLKIEKIKSFNYAKIWESEYDKTYRFGGRLFITVNRNNNIIKSIRRDDRL